MKTCQIDDCDRTVHCRGMCPMHYRRWRLHGDPHAVAFERAADGEPSRWINAVALRFEGDDCLVWPFGKSDNGYGRVSGREFAHRVVCELAHDVPPLPGLHAAHTCGNRACVNPRHLRWATPVENAADKVNHGTNLRGEQCHQTKLTEAQVRKIKASDVGVTALARELQVSPSCIANIRSGAAWSWV